MDSGFGGFVMIRAISVVVAMALIVMPAAAAGEGGVPGTAAEMADYGAREAAAPDLAESVGGGHEVELVAAIFLCILYVIIQVAAAYYDDGHHGHGHTH